MSEPNQKAIEQARAAAQGRKVSPVNPAVVRDRPSTVERAVGVGPQISKRG